MGGAGGGGNRMLSAHKFSQVMVAETGHMAVMHTLAPPTFVAIKTDDFDSPWA